MKGKERTNKREKKNQMTKKDSGVVTKESIFATCALFSFLAFLILCTKSLVFGTLGTGIHTALMGVFGYLAYPLTLGALYLCIMGLLDKRLVKNRKIGWAIGLSVAFLALIAHTAFSYKLFDGDGYLFYCFKSGETFPKTTVAGWLGGLIVYALVQLVSRIGTIIIFSLLAILFAYVAVVLCKKAGEKTDDTEMTEKNQGQAVLPIEIPVSQTPNQDQNQGQGTIPGNSFVTPTGADNNTSGRAQVGNTMPGYTTPTVNQRPGVSLFEGADGTAAQKPHNAFSPFGAAQDSNETPADNGQKTYENYGNSREFLFGGTPAENFRRNLLFDPNANVNKRPVKTSVEPVNKTYIPSYVDAYQTSVNGETPTQRPVKVVTDNTQNYNNGYYNGNMSSNGSQPPQIKPIPTIEEESYSKDPVDFSRYETRHEDKKVGDREDRFEDRGSLRDTTPFVERDSDRNLNSDTNRETEDKSSDGGYRRHDYMDLFSMSNPNIFGRDGDETDRNIDRNTDIGSHIEGDRVSDRNLDREIAQEVEEDRYKGMYIFEEDKREDDRNTGRDGLSLFDEEENIEDSRDADGRDFSRDITSSRNDLFGSSREEFSEEIDTNSRKSLYDDRGAGRADTDFDFGLDRGRNVDSNGFSVVGDVPAQKLEEDNFVKIEEPKPVPAPPKPRVIRPYVRVPLDDFDCRDIEPTANQMEVEDTKANIIATLEEFKVTGASIASVTFGPTVTRYNVTIPRNISPKKVVSLDQSIAISLHSSGVNVYPNYEDGVVSIEVPNKERQFVQLGCMLSGDTFVNAKPSSIMFAMGKDVANRKVYGDISKMIHLLVAGSSGSGKSVFLGSLIISLIYKYSPEELRLILIDPKKTEFVLYNDLPHLMINEIITDVGKAVQSLNWAIGEMNRRYTLFEQMSRTGKYVVNLDQYNEQLEKKDRLPKIVIIIDELADLMLAAKKEMEDRIQNLTQKARAAGIHLIVATQRPSTDVITGVIKSNLPTRVAFYVATDVDSRVILDQTGAQKLLGKGDFLYTMPGLVAPARVQSAFISPEESQRVVNFIKNNNEAYYDEEATAFINSRGGYGGDDSGAGVGEKEIDPMHIEALRHVIISGSASISMIQRKCSAGYNRAGKIVEWMEDMGYISPFDGAKARKVLITKEEFESKYGPLQ